MINMLSQKQTCIEIGAETCYIWQIDRKGKISESSKITIPESTLWDPQAMSELINVHISASLFILLNTAKTIIRVGGALPIDRKSDEYVFSSDIIGDTVWNCAVPTNIPESLVEMCRIRGIRFGRIHSIDTLEYRMACYLIGLYTDPICLIIPQSPGIRLIFMKNNTEKNSAEFDCYFFSNDIEFRERELTRIWLCQPSAPHIAVVLSEEHDYLWIREFLRKQTVEVPDGSTIRRDMIESWIKA